MHLRHALHHRRGPSVVGVTRSSQVVKVTGTREPRRNISSVGRTHRGLVVDPIGRADARRPGTAARIPLPPIFAVAELKRAVEDGRPLVELLYNVRNLRSSRALKF